MRPARSCKGIEGVHRRTVVRGAAPPTECATKSAQGRTRVGTSRSPTWCTWTAVPGVSHGLPARLPVAPPQGPVAPDPRPVRALIPVRHGKRPTGPALTFSPSAWTTFVGRGPACGATGSRGAGSGRSRP
ncbi:DUF397 domain-containing protein [Streptomyces sp. NPDC006655]|uniref:DUF397 domain-containing protein n=1 Tax=Streptomyces sp. NPDC006655 TaxID=3156898 RepID=UPI003456F791